MPVAAGVLAVCARAASRVPSTGELNDNLMAFHEQAGISANHALLLSTPIVSVFFNIHTLLLLMSTGACQKAKVAARLFSAPG